jgi:hypothetical protein
MLPSTLSHQSNPPNSFNPAGWDVVGWLDMGLLNGNNMLFERNFKGACRIKKAGLLERIG